MAVHTKLSRTDIDNILINYKLGSLYSFEGIKDGIENTNYLILTKNNKYIITIFEKRVNISSIPFYLKIMINSKKKGIQCPVPIKNKKGEYIQTIKNKKLAIFSFVEGTSISEWESNHCEQVGNKLAKFHQANLNIPEKLNNDFSVDYWNLIFLKYKDNINQIIPNSIKTIKAEIDYVSNNWPKTLPAGVIHADLFPDNVFFSNDKVSGFLDFYFSCNDYFSYDLAITINAWCFRKGVFSQELFSNIIRGYQTVRKLQSLEKKCFNLLLRGAALRFLFTRINDSIMMHETKFLKKKKPEEFFNILNFHINNEKDMRLD